MLKAVIFDIDGTLGDTLPLCVEAYRQCVAELGHPRPTQEDVVSHFGLSDRGVLGALLGMDPENPSLPIQQFAEIYKRLMPQLAPKPFDGAVELLQALQQAGLRLAVISGKEHYTGDPTIAAYGFDQFFAWRGYGLPTHNCKAERLQEIMNLWQLQPEELVYVGDAPSDIELCHQVGVRIINAAWASTAANEAQTCLALQPDFRLNHISDVLPLISSL